MWGYLRTRVVVGVMSIHFKKNKKCGDKESYPQGPLFYFEIFIMSNGI